jgi:predicted ester cyclase
MTKQAAVEFIRRYFAALRRDKSEATLDEFINEELLLQHIAFYEAVFPGYWLEAEDVIADDDRIAVRMKIHGTHKGELRGIPPTGKDVTFDGIIIYRLANGKIVEHWMQTDTMSLMQQLGAMAPASAG